MRKLLCLPALIALAAPAYADMQFEFTGYADFRLVSPPSNDASWLKGGLGKTRYGDKQSPFQFAGAVGKGSVLFTPELQLVGVARLEPDQKTFPDLLEAYVRYRPASTNEWRWSVMAGAFFAPFSLENNELGWAPYWTLTPSAINTWFGEELRTLGGQGTLEWRRDEGKLTLTAGVFGWNDPAGVMIADRGWALDDRPTSLFEELREPNATLISFHKTPPDSTPIFDEFDHSPGWYGGASWDDSDGWHLDFYRYDNAADPSAHQDDYYAWRTKFWDVGFSNQFGEFTVLSQALTGDTTISPSPTFTSITEFDSAYALLGWERGEWRLAGRGDIFHTRTHNPFGASPNLSENGYALTASASWLPNDWLRLTWEALSVTSKRGERSVVGINPAQTETQFQFSARVYLN